MATYSTKKLAMVQFPSTKGDLYDPPVSTKGLIHNIVLFNNNTTTEVVTIYYHDGTNEYIIYQLSLLATETVQLNFANEGLLVDASSKLTGFSTTAAKVTFLATGSEEV